MTRHMTSHTKVGIFAFLAFATLALAGCGNHDQADTSGGNGTMTPAQVQENAQKQNQPSAAAGGQNTAGAPAAPATH